MLFLLLGYFSYQLIVLFCQAVNVAADLPALVFICWNYLVVGLLALGAGKMPLRVMQFYHVTLSAIMACQFLYEETSFVYFICVSVCVSFFFFFFLFRFVSLGGVGNFETKPDVT